MIFISLRTGNDYDPIHLELFFITGSHCVFCGVRTESLNEIVVTFVCKGVMECDIRFGECLLGNMTISDYTIICITYVWVIKFSWC